MIFLKCFNPQSCHHFLYFVKEKKILFGGFSKTNSKGLFGSGNEKGFSEKNHENFQNPVAFGSFSVVKMLKLKNNILHLQKITHFWKCVWKLFLKMHYKICFWFHFYLFLHFQKDKETLLIFIK